MYHALDIAYPGAFIYARSGPDRFAGFEELCSAPFIALSPGAFLRCFQLLIRAESRFYGNPALLDPMISFVFRCFPLFVLFWYRF